VRVTQYKIEGLGHLSTLIADEAAGTAAVVDPRRDVDIYLEAARAEVLVRQAVAREVEDRPQKERRRSGPARRTCGSARGHVKRDDDGCLPSRHHESERRVHSLDPDRACP